MARRRGAVTATGLVAVRGLVAIPLVAGLTVLKAVAHLELTPTRVRVDQPLEGEGTGFQPSGPRSVDLQAQQEVVQLALLPGLGVLELRSPCGGSSSSVSCWSSFLT